MTGRFAGAAKLAAWSDDLRRAFVPLRRTSQDKALLEAAHLSTRRLQACNLVIVTQFRGARKTTTARRCAIRSRFFFWQTRIVHIQQTPHDNPKAGGPFPSFLQSLVKLAVDVAFSLAVVTVIVSVQWAWKLRGSWREGVVRGSDDRGLGERLRDELPSRENPLALCLMLLIVRTRKTVYVLDDVMQVASSSGSVKLTLRGSLDYLQRMSTALNIVIITSNEGLTHCFSDPAQDIRIERRFPAATSAEMLHAIGDSTAIYPWLAGVGEEDLAAVTKRYPEHHALSMRFWNAAAKTLTVPPSQFASCARPPRSFLWHIVLEVDTASDAAFRVYALGHSAPMSDAERAKVAALVGLADVDKIPRNCPRRLALAHALLASATDEEAANERDNAERVVKRLKDGLRSPHLSDSASSTPLIALMRATRETGTFWVQQIDDAGKPVDIIRPIDAPERTLEALQLAMKNRWPDKFVGVPDTKILIFPRTSTIIPIPNARVILRDSTETEPYYFRVPSTAAPKDSGALKQQGVNRE